MDTKVKHHALSAFTPKRLRQKILTLTAYGACKHECLYKIANDEPFVFELCFYMPTWIFVYALFEQSSNDIYDRLTVDHETFHIIMDVLSD